MLNSKVHLSTLCLVTLGLFDLVTTVMLFGRGFGEGNPLFAWLAGQGPWHFVFGKAIFLVLPVLALEYVRKRHPHSAEQGTWIAFIAYATLYVLQLLRIRNQL
ncbi:MAG: hypothetical protein J0H02_03700 [Armatimonadetes bacterium]|nr:hypothetical protein [Armatimonadota bacterium]